MAGLVFGNPHVVLRFGGCIRLWKPNENLLETLYGLFKVIQIKFNLALTQDDLGNIVLRRQESDKSMVLLAVRIQNDDRGGPFYCIPLDERFVLVEINLKRYKIILYRETDIRIGVSNSCQLLASDSEIIIKIDQDQFLFLLRLCLSRCERSLPLNLFPHNEPSFRHE